MSAERKIFKLTDEVIAQMREMIQLSMLTGTNVTDHFRQLRLEANEDETSSLQMTPEYCDYFKGVVVKMVDEIDRLQKAEEVAQDEAAMEPKN